MRIRPKFGTEAAGRVEAQPANRVNFNQKYTNEQILIKSHEYHHYTRRGDKDLQFAYGRRKGGSKGEIRASGVMAPRPLDPTP